MGEREIAVVVRNGNENVSAYQTIDSIKKAGFKNVFIEWYNKDFVPSQEEQLKYARSQGLNVIFAHLGYQNINDLWVEGDQTELVQRYKNDLKALSENNIDLAIMHLTTKRNAEPYNEKGIKRLQEIADYAKSLNIRIAFENTRLKGYLDYVIENIKNDNVGICFDSGHYHAHFDDELDFSKFKDRVFAIHFHDNDKSADQHLIPFDGTLDWEETVKRVKTTNYKGPITLEVTYQNDYLNMSLDEFYEKAYRVALKLKDMFEKI